MQNDSWLTLYFIPSPYGLNWNSPTSLARDIVKNKIALDRRFMGHVNIELQYTNENAEEVQFMTGMAAEILNGPELLIKNQIGLGIVFHSFKGKLESQDELRDEYKKRYSKGNKALNFVQFKIHPTNAKRVEEYIKLYQSNGIHRYYGLVNSPLHGEGSGCSAFGASFLAVTGLLEDEHFDHWTQCVKVPHKLIGNPLFDKKINFLKLLFGNYEWAQEHEDHHEIFFWDPDLMHRWVEQKIKTHNQASDYELIQKENVTGIRFDVSSKEAPHENIFKVTNEQGLPFSRKPDLSYKSNTWKYK